MVQYTVSRLNIAENNSLERVFAKIKEFSTGVCHVQAQGPRTQRTISDRFSRNVPQAFFCQLSGAVGPAGH